jgi:anaerobic selenocysteine-containing dehydrogenase
LVSELLSGTMLGFQADLDARMTILIGWNPVVSHGHAFFFPSPRSVLRRWAAQGEMWVLDPRRTETARLATRHVATRPGTDYAVLGFLIRELLIEGADWDFLNRFTTGIDQVAEVVERYTRDHVADLTGVAADVLDDLLAAVRRAGRIGTHTGTGVTFSRAANITVWFEWVLGAVTGSLDRPGGIWFNPGYFARQNEVGWEPMDTAMPGVASRPELMGRMGELPCAVLTGEIEAGNLRALLVVGGNPVIALPETKRLVSALKSLDALAVADVIPTATTEHATHVLPAVGQLERGDVSLMDVITATTFGQYTPAVVKPVGERRHNWWILAQLASRLGFSILPGGLSPDECTDEDLLSATLTASGRSLDELREHHQHGVAQEVRPFGWVDRWLPNGRWQLAPQQLVDQASSLAVPERSELTLITGRQLRKINSQLADGLTTKGDPEHAGVWLSPEDAARLGITDKQFVTVASRHGELSVRAQVDADVPLGVVMIPSGYEQFNVSTLTSATDGVDPITGMVEQSGIPVTVMPAAILAESDPRTS